LFCRESHRSSKPLPENCRERLWHKALWHNNPQTAEALLTLTSPFFTALTTDDLTDAILCAKKIVKETQGMNYW